MYANIDREDKSYVPLLNRFLGDDPVKIVEAVEYCERQRRRDAIVARIHGARATPPDEGHVLARDLQRHERAVKPVLLGMLAPTMGHLATDAVEDALAGKEAHRGR